LDFLEAKRKIHNSLDFLEAKRKQYGQHASLTRTTGKINALEVDAAFTFVHTCFSVLHEAPGH
jgi:hypothetical protein